MFKAHKLRSRFVRVARLCENYRTQMSLVGLVLVRVTLLGVT
jgi:hypothetical protein